MFEFEANQNENTRIIVELNLVYFKVYLSESDTKKTIISFLKWPILCMFVFT